MSNMLATTFCTCDISFNGTLMCLIFPQNELETLWTKCYTTHEKVAFWYYSQYDSLLGLLYYVELQPDSNVLQVLNETNQVNKWPFSGWDTYMYVSLWAEVDRKWMVNSLMSFSLSIWSIPSNLSNFSDWSQFLQSCLYD
jgi:hypothetical protein